MLFESLPSLLVPVISIVLAPLIRLTFALNSVVCGLNVNPVTLVPFTLSETFAAELTCCIVAVMAVLALAEVKGFVAGVVMVTIGGTSGAW